MHVTSSDNSMSPDLPTERPHRLVSRLLDSLSSVPDSIGDTVSEFLDKLPLGRKGPHETLSNVAQGLMEAGKKVGEGVSEGLDKPLEMAERV